MQVSGTYSSDIYMIRATQNLPSSSKNTMHTQNFYFQSFLSLKETR